MANLSGTFPVVYVLRQYLNQKNVVLVAPMEFSVQVVLKSTKILKILQNKRNTALFVKGNVIFEICVQERLIFCQNKKLSA
jgi:hypothetical protein